MQPSLKRREYLDSRSGTEKTPDAYYYAFCILHSALLIMHRPRYHYTMKSLILAQDER